MLTEHNYKDLPKDWDKKIKECCSKEDPEFPQGSDCCYDKWVKELKGVLIDYQAAEEDAKQVKNRLGYLIDRRNNFKKWYDELLKANDLGKAICDQLEIMCKHTEKVSTNTQLTTDSIKILFCMIRDYYLQLDLLKTEFDEVMDCIKCLDNPILNGGKLKELLLDYGTKLEAAMAARDELLKMVMDALVLANKLDHNIGLWYGLQTVLIEWKDTFNCSIECDDETEAAEDEDCGDKGKKDGKASSDGTKCRFRPILKLPICKDTYYDDVYQRYLKDKADAEELSKDLVELNKKKESLLACKESLVAAIKEVDPKTRCK